MTIDRHPDWYDVVRTHWNRTQGFLLASREPCVTIRDEEIEAVTGRSLVSRDVDELASWHPPESWILAVILCPGDEVSPVVDWVRARNAAPERVWFFLHRSTPEEILRPWDDAGLPLDQVDLVEDWRQLHPLLGLARNDRVYADWKHLS